MREEGKKKRRNMAKTGVLLRLLLTNSSFRPIDFCPFISIRWDEWRIVHWSVEDGGGGSGSLIADCGLWIADFWPSANIYNSIKCRAWDRCDRSIVADSYTSLLFLFFFHSYINNIIINMMIIIDIDIDIDIIIVIVIVIVIDGNTKTLSIDSI